MSTLAYSLRRRYGWGFSGSKLRQIYNTNKISLLMETGVSDEQEILAPPLNQIIKLFGVNRISNIRKNEHVDSLLSWRLQPMVAPSFIVGKSNFPHLFRNHFVFTYDFCRIFPPTIKPDVIDVSNAAMRWVAVIPRTWSSVFFSEHSILPITTYRCNPSRHS